MILVFDLGNSELKIGVYDNDTLIHSFRYKTDHNKTSDEYASLIKDCLDEANVKKEDIEGTILSSVVLELTLEVARAISKVAKEPIILGAGVKTSLVLKCDNPNEVGSDIVACCVGALKSYNVPIILVDLGTATKIIAISKKKEFCGCIICPGLQISASALTKNASALPELTLSLPKKVIGTNTVDCMKSGVVVGHGCMVEGLVKRVKEELGEDSQVVITGGLSEIIAPTLTIPFVLDKYVLFNGLKEIYRKNSYEK